MNNILRSVLAISLLFTIYGCVKDDKVPLNQENLHKVVFHAGWAPETKTVRQEDGSVWWSPGDEISLFTGEGDNGGYKLTSTNTAPAANVDFVGEIGDKPENASYIAIYPYNTSNRVSGQNVYATIPSNQVAKEGTFENELFVSIAVSDNENLFFHNICSGIKFSVSTPGIKKVVITNRDNSTFSGIVQYNLESGSISSGSSNNSVTVTAPNETGFETGKYYYAVIYPTTISTGFDITYYTDNTVGKYIFNGSVEFKKGVFKRVYEKDKDITFYPYHENSAKLYASTLLPDNVDKTKITDVSFIVNSDKTTDISIQRYGEPPIYFELDGTTAHYYTAAEVYGVVDATGMFMGWTALESLDLTNFETVLVTKMTNMFACCKSLKSIVFGNFSTINVESMERMFNNCLSLESLDLSGFITNNVKSMSGMFAGCTSLKSLNLSAFETSNVEDMSSMFGMGTAEYMSSSELAWSGCSSLENLDLHSFNTSKVRTMVGMFRNCLNLKTVNLSEWNTSNVEYISDMFMYCSSLESVDLSSFDTRNVISMGHMFEECNKLKSLDLSNFNTSNVTNMESMFNFCESLQSLDIRNFDASNLNEAISFLGGAYKMKKLDLGTFDLSKVNNILWAFSSLAFKSHSVAIRCIDATKQVIENCSDGMWFNLDKVIWVGLNEAFPDLPDITDPEMYYSEDFSMDKKVKILQTATQGKGIDIVIMGDAYSDRLIAEGTYESDMREAIDAIFNIEPMKTYKGFFNVYMVYAVSENEVEHGSTVFDVHQVGNDLRGLAYARTAVSNKPLSDVAIIILGHDRNAFTETIANVVTNYQFGGDEYYDYGQAEYSIAYCGMTGDAEEDANTFVHEFGHLFAKLADEYVRKDEAIGTSNEYEIQNLIDLISHTGAYKNIDLTSDPETIKWSRFLKDSRYANENLGAFEGGLLYSKGVWRPNENSIMRTGTTFNAPSREAIYYRIHKLAYGEDWQYDYETFVQQDLKNISSGSQMLSSAKNIPYPARVNKKHVFKMEKSIAPDGRKMITVIMD